MHLYDTGAERSVFFHFADIVGEKEHLRIADIGHKRQGLSVIADNKAAVGDILFFNITPCFQICLPRCAEGRIGKAEVKSIAGESVV